MSEQLMLPKKDEEGKYYLSYSQYTKWLDNNRNYIRRYFFGEKEEGNAYFDFGHKVGEALENNDFSAFETEREVKLMKSIPRYDEFERKIKLDMGWFYVVGYIDTNNVEQKGKKKGLVTKIADYKTGEMKQEALYKSKDYKQLHIYAEAINQEQGCLPEQIDVFLIERLGNPYDKNVRNRELILGDEVRHINKTDDITAESIQETKDIINKSAEGISDCYKIYLKLKEIFV